MLLKDNPSVVLKVLSNMPSSFMNMISMKTILVQGRSTAAFSGELCLLLFMGNFSAAVPAVCH